jgi:hypothetical protein
MNGDEFYDKVAKTLHRTTDEVRERFEQAHTGIVCVGIYCRKCGDLKEWRYFGGPSWGGSAGDEVEKEVCSVARELPDSAAPQGVGPRHRLQSTGRHLTESSPRSPAGPLDFATTAGRIRDLPGDIWGSRAGLLGVGVERPGGERCTFERQGAVLDLFRILPPGSSDARLLLMMPSTSTAWAPTGRWRPSLTRP